MIIAPSSDKTAAALVCWERNLFLQNTIQRQQRHSERQE